MTGSYEHLSSMEEDTEYELSDFELNIDPESNMFKSIDTTCSYYTEEQVRDNVKLGNTFSLIHFNCRSLYNSFTLINDYLDTLKGKFKVIALSETWINEDRGNDFHINGYELYHINRSNKKAGGVALFVDSDLKCKPVEYMTVAIDDLMECITVEIEMEKMRNIIVTCLYRKPGSTIESFTNQLEELLNKLHENKTYFLCGDGNVDLLKVKSHKASSDFLDMLYGRGLYPLITKPSRITETSATLIDHIFTNSLENSIISGLVINDVSDHLPVFATFDCQMKRNTSENVDRYIRKREDEKVNRFRDDLLNEDWNGVYINDVNVAYESFLRTYLALYNKNCPLVVYKHKIKSNRKPWMTKGLENACKKKNNLYRDFIKHRTKTAETKYKVYKNKLVLIMRKARKDYYNKLLKENNNNVKGTWNILNKVMGNTSTSTNLPSYFSNNNKVIKDRSVVVNEFNSFFVNMGPKLADLIKTDESVQGGWKGDSKVMQSMFLREVSEKEIVSIVKKLKNKTSTDCDGLDMVIVKKTVDCIIKPLCYIFNLSFHTGIFPDRMKVAKVIPLLKSGDKHSFNNYRPVSLLSQFSKLIEKLFAQRFDCFIDKHQLLSESQYGFRKNRSTATALTNIIEEITTATHQNKYTIGVFIDLRKAFDTLNHSILISKLYTYGVRGMVLDWMRSYLDNRQQYVQYAGKTSECMKIKCGVPQGSVLGPKLFNLYINDICDVSKILRFVLFADDTNFHCSGYNLQELSESIVHEMKKLKNWFDVNKLSLNLEKTKFMIFGNREKEHEVILSINGADIERVSEFRFLGVIMDEKLTWKSHIAHVKKKMSKSIFILNKVKHVLDSEAMRTLYCSLVSPYLSYCAEVWGNTYVTTVNPLYMLQKRAIRIIHKAHYREHTNRLFIKSRVLKLEEIVKLQTLLFMFRAKIKTLPVNLQGLFEASSESGESRRKYDFKHQFARTNQKQMCPSVIGIRMWNSLDNDLKGCSNIYKFKRCYKENIFKQYEDME